MLSGDKALALYWLKEAAKYDGSLGAEAEKSAQSLQGALSAEEREGFAEFFNKFN